MVIVGNFGESYLKCKKSFFFLQNKFMLTRKRQLIGIAIYVLMIDIKTKLFVPGGNTFAAMLVDS